MQALQRSHDLKDSDWLVKASKYRCPSGPADCGWNIRLTAVQLLDKRIAIEAAAIDDASHDPTFQVRLTALQQLGCEAMLRAFADPAEIPAVRLELMKSARANVRSMATSCAPTSSAVTVLLQSASTIDTASDWHEPARALEGLVLLDPQLASSIFRERAIGHRVWQVRAAAARVAAGLLNDAALVTLSNDAVPNVRTEALAGLARLKSPNLVAAAVAALDSMDHQLVREAATVIPVTADRERAVPALLRALDRLTGDGKDNSRDARVAIIKRLQELQATADLGAYLSDFDPAIATAAADAIAASGQPRPTPRPRRRAPEQPTEADLRALPTRATITMDSGSVIELDLLVDQAPITVARFVKLARAGYYNGLTFHRVEPLFVIQGGSPGASEYVGDARFMRDEVGTARHVRGAVGISTRGRDTGDAQIFIDLIDVPRLNDSYTVFAQVRDVVASNTVMDRVLEGAVIKTVKVQ
jgi:cyclophilin family peptidyl-prolyl cis-trans isomerase